MPTAKAAACGSVWRRAWTKVRRLMAERGNLVICDSKTN